MKKGILVVLCLILFVIVSCGKEKSWQTVVKSISDKPEIVQVDGTFVVVQKVEKLEGFDMGRVFLNRVGDEYTDDKYIFTALVIPMRQIPVGQKVNVSKVTYITSGVSPAEFWIVE